MFDVGKPFVCFLHRLQAITDVIRCGKDGTYAIQVSCVDVDVLETPLPKIRFLPLPAVWVRIF